MPIYEYECARCGRVTEVLQGFNDKPLKRCKHCKGKLERIMSLSSFQLRGNGWYSTDYAKNAGIPPQAESQDNPALSDSSNNNTKGVSKEKSSEQVQPKPAASSSSGSSRKVVQKDGVQRTE
ncbi:zinc ribbon domain-containing protein [Desulfobacterota bacterium AH_259_B03_O07]|nr:zinc ribbon domain-containing protein [Desulfobacterota bacterium AH_259_B03_O07]